ncbi:MAG: hypothetical protein KF891_01530 [Rhizobacter sp.]|nr:hypothetical protein [Rhizobacter sp.]
MTVVHVVAFRKNPDSPIEIRVTPDVLDLTQYSKGARTIQWILDTRGYHFPDDGTAIEFTSPGSEKSFGKVKVACKGKVAQVRNNNDDGLAYAYTVRVIDESTGARAVLDPIVQNQSP